MRRLQKLNFPAGNPPENSPNNGVSILSSKLSPRDIYCGTTNHVYHPCLLFSNMDIIKLSPHNDHYGTSNHVYHPCLLFGYIDIVTEIINIKGTI